MTLAKKILLLAGDIFLLYLSLFLTVLLRYGSVEIGEKFKSHLFPFSFIFILWIIIFYLSELYHPKKLRTGALIFNTLLKAVSISVLVSIIIFYIFGNIFKLTPKTNLLIFATIFFILNFFWRTSLIKFFAAGALGIVVLGNSRLVEETVNFISKNPQTGYRITNWFKKVDAESLQEIEKLVKAKNTQIVVVLQTQITKETLTILLKKLLPLQANFVSFWDFYELIFEKIPLDELEESWFLENITANRPIYETFKRMLDFLLSGILVIIMLPIAAVIALIVKITSKGPVIYKQQRAGKNNLPITIYKFRTMNVTDEGPLWTEKDDKRITAVGKFLRHTHLDEIPQLWNIIRGDISFTGPRPEHIRLAEQFKQLPHYEIRHIVKPGLTGWAQINYRPSASLEEAKEKLCYDLFYIKNRSFLLDLRIIVRTLKYLFASHE
jgi:exopolysaccharide biosynthesis polyprenyl glycosylphosphotransferase